MSLALQIWLSLACALPIVSVWAIIIALTSRFRWKISRWYLPMFAGPFVAVFVVLIVDVISGVPLQFRNVHGIEILLQENGGGSTTPFTVVVVALMVHLLATIALAYWGLWRSAEGAPAARLWRFKRLSLGLIGSVGFLVVTLVLQSWIVCGIARRTVQAIAAESKTWESGTKLVDSPIPSEMLQAIFDDVLKSKNPAFEIKYSPYLPLKNISVRKELELGNKLARLHVEVLDAALRATPFRPANKDLLAWDRQELASFRKILNAARLATMVAIEENNHETVIRYLNILALCRDQLRVISDSDCLILSMAFASTRSALLERWIAESVPPGPFLTRIKPSKSPPFVSQREGMLRQLEGIMLYEHARMLLGEPRWSGDKQRIWLVKDASKATWDPTLIVDRVFLGADNLLLAPAIFETYRPRFLVPPAQWDGFGYGLGYRELNGRATLARPAAASFSVLCSMLATEDTRGLVTGVALQVAQYRQAEQKFPDSLEQLVPKYLSAVPIDPCDGHPLRYLREGAASAIVYSVGNDRQDHQRGKPQFQGDRNTADIIFCLGDAYRQRRIPQLDKQ